MIHSRGSTLMCLSPPPSSPVLLVTLFSCPSFLPTPSLPARPTLRLPSLATLHCLCASFNMPSLLSHGTPPLTLTHTQTCSITILQFTAAHRSFGLPGTQAPSHALACTRMLHNVQCTSLPLLGAVVGDGAGAADELPGDPCLPYAPSLPLCHPAPTSCWLPHPACPACLSCRLSCMPELLLVLHA